LPENLKEEEHLEDLGIDGKIILECILEELWTWFFWLRKRTW
jgi:hypothetical protein